MAESEAMTSMPAAASPQLTVAVRDLDVTYNVYEQPVLNARQLATRGFRSRVASKVEAIRSVNLDFAAGEAVGLVGSNGSGKSTLLRTIAGLQAKSAGHVFVRSQAAVPRCRCGVEATSLRLPQRVPRWSGDRPHQTGDRRAHERGRRVLRARRFDGPPAQHLLVGDAGTPRVLDRHVADPEILLLDEALAVGDRAFRDRSIARINEIRADANTIILVSHNLNEIRETCDRAVWLNAGEIESEGDVETVLDQYEEWSDRGRS
jgi:teichoic acid transport system ATP-binding protein